MALTELVQERIRAAARRARRARFDLLLQTFPDLGSMRVADLGGEVAFWLEAPVRPRELVTVNLWWQRELSERASAGLPWVQNLFADACAPTPELLEERFDLVFSNSVIEHVGGHTRRVAFANTVHALARSHWIQTPNRYFSIEPHAAFPGLQFLPPAAQARALRRWPLGSMNIAESRDGGPQTMVGEQRHGVEDHPPLSSVDRYHAMRMALSIELLSASEMQFLFPESEIVRERAAGVTKSLIAVRR